ncbi:hypothetical protein [Halodesulfovibrio aestuarii]|uniref:hypothetical protein n=1 Tax=Halodesulfovibrio aestuarii TaxID=126333 RepID=UPI003D32689B
MVGSVITDREYYDSQLTLVQDEAEFLFNFIPYGSILRGNVASDEDAALHRFFHLNTGQYVFLNLVFPKPEKDELRLYLSEERGFKPDAGDFWYLTSQDGELCIGSMPAAEWHRM